LIKGETNQHNTLILNHCDTEDWSNDAENHRNKKLKILIWSQ